MRNYLTRWIILAISLIAIVALFFVFRNQKDNKICNEARIRFTNTDNPMLSNQMILEYLSGNEINFIGVKASTIDLSKMESVLRKNPFVENADCYLDYSGDLRIDVDQREAILRVHPIGKTPYYIDENGHAFPLSDLYTPYVKVATGYITEDLNKKLYTFTSYVNQSGFWKPFVEQIFVRPNGDIVFTTQIGGHEVILGDTTRMEQKLAKLKKFYQRASSNMGWEEYREINLKFKDQVICRK